MIAASTPEAPAAFWQIHSAHLVLLAVWVVVFGGFYLRSRSRLAVSDDGGSRHDRRTAWTWTAALASVASGAVHLGVTGEHFAEATLYGVFFLVLTVVQFAWAAWLLVRPSAAVFYSGAAASALVVLLWVATRTTGIPVGPAAGEVESFGALDVIASAAEAVVVLAAAGQAWGARLFAPVWHALPTRELV